MDIVGALLIKLENFINVYGSDGLLAVGLGVLVALGGCSMGRKK